MINIEAIRIRFFRDMIQTERFQVFRVFGIDENILEEVRSHSDERRLFNYLFDKKIANEQKTGSIRPQDT